MTRNSLSDCVSLAKMEMQKFKQQHTTQELIWVLKETVSILSKNFQVLNPSNVFMVLSVETLQEWPLDKDWNFNVLYLARLVDVNWNVFCKKLSYNELFETHNDKTSVQTKHIAKWSVIILEDNSYKLVWKMNYIESDLRWKNYKNMWIYYLRKLFWFIKNKQ